MFARASERKGEGEAVGGETGREQEREGTRERARESKRGRERPSLGGALGSSKNPKVCAARHSTATVMGIAHRRLNTELIACKRCETPKREMKCMQTFRTETTTTTHVQRKRELVPARMTNAGVS